MLDQTDPGGIIQEYIAINLRRIRLERGETQVAVSHNANVDLTYIQRLERGTLNPTVKSLAKVAAAIGVNASDLLAPCETRLVRPGAGRPSKSLETNALERSMVRMTPLDEDND